MTAIPTLTTSRLTLRPMCVDDWDAYHRLMTSERSLYMGGPFSVSVAWGMFCSDHAQWSLFECGGLMIENTANGDCLGQVGISYGPRQKGKVLPMRQRSRCGRGAKMSDVSKRW